MSKKYKQQRIICRTLLIAFAVSQLITTSLKAQVTKELKEGLTQNQDVKSKKQIVLLPDFQTNGFNFTASIDRYMPSPYSKATYSADQNFVSAKIFTIPTTETAIQHNGDVVEEIQYSDALGRPSQKILVNASTDEKDIVQPSVYDCFGREATKYLPYTQDGNGIFQSDALTQQATFYQNQPNVAHDVPYAVTQFEESPLNRVVKQGAPGADWQPDHHPVSLDYLTNTDADNIKRWKISGSTCTLDGAYSAGELYINVITDENRNKVKAYKDKLGQVILKSTESEDGSLVTNTYYVYDDFGLARYLLPPEAVENLGSLTTLNPSDDLVKKYCFYYEYDSKHRVKIKQVPGSEPVYMVYDNLDRLVLTQDGNQRNRKNQFSQLPNQWHFIKYDILNRPVITGIYTDNAVGAMPQEHMQNYIDGIYSGTTPRNHSVSRNNTGETGYTDESFPVTGDGYGIEYLTVIYYDTYGFPGLLSFDDNNNISGYTDEEGDTRYFEQINGIVTGTKTKVINTTTWLNVTYYYDDKYRLIQSRSDLYDDSNGGKQTVSTQFDFAGKVLQTKQNQTFNSSTTTVQKWFTYDHVGRLLKTEQQIGNNSADRVTLSELTYNELGQIIDKSLHGGKQDINYAYNIRGWLTQINDPENLGSNLFGMKLLYNDQNSNLGNASQYNGNISAMIWNSATKSKQGYAFSYDALNRLKSTDYKTAGNGNWVESNAYEEKSINYDKNGNITNLVRTKSDGNNQNSFGAYVYTGNQLQSFTDAVTNTTYSYTKNGNPAYDDNGNCTFDGLRDIDISYNLLNLPANISKGGDNISYIYSATGEKLAKMMNGVTQQYYASNMVYNNNKSLDYLFHEEGIVKNISGSFTYEYFLNDHLGNTRVVFTPASPTPEQVTEFYPFGLSFQNNNLGVNKYLYNGKELQDESLSGTYLGLYDYGARFYDPQIGRWHSSDGLSQLAPSITPYRYCYNNPTTYFDPSGLWEINEYGYYTTDYYDIKRLIDQVMNHGYEGLLDYVENEYNNQLKFEKLLNSGAYGTKGNDAFVYAKGDPLSLNFEDTRQDDDYLFLSDNKYGWTPDEINKGLKAEVTVLSFFIPVGEIMDVLGVLGKMGYEAVTATKALKSLKTVAEVAEEGIQVADEGKTLVQLNRTAGNAWRDEIVTALEESGKEVDIEVYHWTPFGPRYTDIEVFTQEGDFLGAIEAKVGSSRYTPLQRLKDIYLDLNVEGGYPVQLVRKP